MVSHVEAAKYCGSVRGGSQAQLVETSDAKYFVVKAPNNPQGSRILVNELLGSLILGHLGIPTPEPAIVQIHPWLVSRNDEMRVSGDTGRLESWQPGLCFGSQISSHGWKPIGLCPFMDMLYDHQYSRVVNLETFHEVLMFDLWAMQTDRRQAVFVRPKGKRSFVATMIDQGFCFGGARWSKSPRAAHYTTFRQPQVYDSVFGIDSFEPIMNRMRRKLNLRVLRKLAAEIPEEWISDRAQFDELLCLLNDRLKILEDLVNDLHLSGCSPFRNWEKTPKYKIRSAFDALSFEDHRLIPPFRFEEPIAAD